jgi:ABC-2 type transport system permease protein
VVPDTEKFAHYLPDESGSMIMWLIEDTADDRPYGPWGGLAIMVLWVAAALLAGYTVLKRRDA